MLRRLLRLYKTAFTLAVRRIECRRRRDHALVLCHIEVQRGTGTQRHIHECAWCGTRVLEQVTPVDNDIQLLLRDLGIQIDPGLPLPQQQEFMH